MTWYWHVHHDVLAEKSNNIVERIADIIHTKPKHEIETRLRLLNPAKGVERVWAKYEKTENSARKKYMKIKHSAWFKYEKIVKQVLRGKKTPYQQKLAREKYKRIKKNIWVEYEKKHRAILAEYRAEIKKLHKEQCGCSELDNNVLVL